MQQMATAYEILQCSDLNDKNKKIYLQSQSVQEKLTCFQIPCFN